MWLRPWLWLLLLGLAVSVNAEETQQIAPGDKVSVLVYGEPELSVTEARVLEDGSLAFPLLGEVKVGGLTPLQLKQLLTQRLADGYLKRPEVAVAVESGRSYFYFVTGAVNKPGRYPLMETMSVQQAILAAGGFNDRASKNKLSLTRPPATEPRPAKADEPVKSGDIIAVGESFF